MHSGIVRIQNTFGFFTTVVSFVAAFVALSSFFLPQNPTGSLTLRDVKVASGKPHYYSRKREEYAYVRFTLDMDLSSLYNWNTKQVFVYVAAVYPSHNPGSPPSKHVIWDAILPSKLSPWHQNQYIHPTEKPLAKGQKKRRIASKARIYAADDLPGVLRVKGQKPKYVITDITGSIGGRPNATLELGWNVQPWVGFQTWRVPSDIGVWKALVGGSTDGFDLPGKGEKATGMDTIKGGEANRGKPA